MLRGLATGQESATDTDADGRFQLDAPAAGTYLVIVTRPGFSEAARTIVLESADANVDVPVQLELGGFTAQVSVTAARSERETRQIPLHVETITRASIEQANTLSTGDALSTVANITPVGNGPFGVRPRLRGLDSTRLLVLVDGERLNTARQATDRQGAEVGLISPDAISRMEIVNGAGTLLYGSDALAGTINIITNEPGFSSDTRLLYGFNGFYSSNENGARGTATIGASGPRLCDPAPGGNGVVRQLHGRLARPSRTRIRSLRPARSNRADTIDDNFGFAFNAFPDPFNAPYVRTSNDVPNSGGNGHFINLSGQVKLGENRTVRVRYQRRQMNDVGFPDFAPAVLLQRHVAAAKRSGSRVGPLRSESRHAVAGESLADRPLPEDRAAAAQPAAGAVPGADAGERSSRSACSASTSSPIPSSASRRRASICRRSSYRRPITC